MKVFGKPLLAFVLFLVIQFVVAFLISVPISFYSKMKEVAETGQVSADNVAVSPTTLTIILIISSIVTVIVMWKPMDMVNLKESFKGLGVSAGKAVWVVLAALVGILGINLINEMVDLPNIIGDELTMMSSTVLGVLAISVLGPLAEEVTMRGAIQGWLHTHGIKPLWAILFASFLFGVMHFNPAQIPFAMCVGIILGVVFWKTGSLVLPCVIHMINNGLSCFLMNTVGEDYLMYEHVGGKVYAIILAVGCFIICAAGLYWQLKPASEEKSVA